MTATGRRAAAAASLSLALAAIGVAPTGAQAPESLPNLTITLARDKAPVVEPTGLRPGATEIVGTTRSKNERSFIVARLRPGVTVEQFTNTLGTREPSERTIDRLGKQLSVFIAQNSASRGAESRTIVDLLPGTYVVGDITGRSALTSLEVAGDTTLAALPDVDGTIDMLDYKFTKKTKTLPADGTLRVRNRGKQLHMTIAFPASSSRNASKMRTAFRKNRERQAERLIAGPPTELVGLVSPGTENRRKVKLRKGHYVLVCFWGSPASKNKQHNTLGMVRKVRFR